MGPLHRSGLDRRGFLKIGGLAGLGWLTPVGELLAEQAETGREPARSIILLWMAGGPEPARDLRPPPRLQDRRGNPGDRDGRQGPSARRRVRPTGRSDGSSVGRPVAREQGRRPRAGDVPDEDRLSPRPDRRAPFHRRDLLPRATGRRDRDPPTRLDPPRQVALAWRVPRRRVRRLPARRPLQAPARRRQPGPHHPRRPADRRPRHRREGLREGSSRAGRRHAPPRDPRPRPDPDDLRAAQGLRPLARARRASGSSTATPRSAGPAWPPDA